MLQAEKVRHVNTAYFHRIVREDSIMTSEKKYSNFHGIYITYTEMLKYIEDNSTKYKKILEVYLQSNRFHNEDYAQYVCV